MLRSLVGSEMCIRDSNILRRLTDLQRQVQLLFEDCASRSKPEAADLLNTSQNDLANNNNNHSLDEVELFKRASDIMWQAVRQFPTCVDSFTESYSLFALSLIHI
eukprot:TRINITY_DN63923_c0_g1_i1.p1 TRINITY_DN63923_c0_g1~~TRINITY_DN63923_c0_g1_i1.p1  ORF type:complete len:113 (-),score=28.46 TRINITY_DN63923_c0_g1_i1:50-364(-)